jgi:uncharacterized protein YgiM (DUF1202 family)
MKMKLGLIGVVTLFTGLATVLAADPPPALAVPGATNSTAAPAPAEPPPVVTPAPVTDISTNKPAAKKSTKKKDAAKKAEKKKPAEPAAPPLILNEPAVAKQSNVNVRAQAHINSEIVTHLKSGETVTVLEEITLKHPKTDEPSHWARISLPAGTHVWINSAYISETNQSVKVPKLNIRSGAGENYSVIGTLVKGDAVKPITTKGEWTEIEAPTNAFGFVAAHLLSHKAKTEPITPALVPTETVVQNTVPIAPPPTAGGSLAGDTPTTTPTPTPTPVAPPPTVNPIIPVALPEPAAEEPPPKRVVQREGIVGGTVSIQAPSHYELKSIDDGRLIDYLYTSSTNVVLKRYKGRTVLVSGEEELDERWPNTPVLTIQSIQVVE